VRVNSEKRDTHVNNDDLSLLGVKYLSRKLSLSPFWPKRAKEKKERTPKKNTSEKEANRCSFFIFLSLFGGVALFSWSSSSSSFFLFLLKTSSLCFSAFAKNKLWFVNSSL